MTSYPIFLPFNNGSSVRVYVSFFKKYGIFYGYTLIDKYSKIQQHKPKREKVINKIVWCNKNNGLKYNTDKTIIKGDLKYILSLNDFKDYTHRYTRITLNKGILQDKLTIGKTSFNPVSVILILEEIFNFKFLCRYSHRLRKRVINTTLEFAVFVDNKHSKPVVFCGKSKGYILTPKLKYT